MLYSFFTLVVAVVALPQFAESQDAAAIQDRLRWLNSFAMSSALYHSHMQALGLDIKAASPSPYQPPGLWPSPPSPNISYVATNDSPNQDVEPTISNVLMGYTPSITSAYMTYSTTTHFPLIRSTTTTDSFSSFTYSTLPLPAAIPAQRPFAQAWDPFLTANTGGGVAPGRMYAVGIAATQPLPAMITAVSVWSSDNGGSAWSSPVIIDSNVTDTSSDVDKPHIAVNTNNGHVFVTYLHYTAWATAAIRFSLSTNGGTNFSVPATLASGNLGGPQLAVNSANNNLYLVWADYDCNCLRVSTSTNEGTSWSASIGLTPANGYLIGPMPYPNQPVLSNGIRIFTLPMVKYNPVASVLGVTWHQREDNGTTNPVPTDTYYSTFNGSTWLSPVVVAATAGVNEFMPALDSDDDGNVSITYYSTQASTDNARYREWLAFRVSNGRVIRVNRITAPLWSDPHLYTIYPNFIGDYQDGTSIRDMGYRKYVPAWVGIDAGFNPPHGEIHFTDVNY